jgi:transglutaminase-like putative cysteine protease
MRATALATLVLLAWSTLGFWRLVAWAQSPPSPAAAARHKTAAEKFEEILKVVEDIAEEFERTMYEGADTTVKFGQLKTIRRQVEAVDGGVRAEFSRIESQLIAAGLPAVILQRHADAVAAYDAGVRDLRQRLRLIEELEDGRRLAESRADQTEAQAKRRQVSERVSEVRAYLQGDAKKRHHPLDPQRLPHRTPTPNTRQPRLKKEDFTELRAPMWSALDDLNAPSLVQNATGPPKPEDVAETIDVQFTQQIRDLAAQLGNNPVRIYSWVRNNIGFTPTYGSIQGADGCLLSRVCNAMDTASLLIGLLRVSGIAARYAVGTIEVPIAEIMNWAGGFTDAKAAMLFIATGGTPIAGILSGGQPVAARLEHVWIEAFVDYIPSRGAVHREGDTWIPMDATFKRFHHTTGVDLTQAAPFDGQAFVDQIKATAVIDEAHFSVRNVNTALVQQTAQDLGARISNYVKTQGVSRTLGGLVGGRNIIPEYRPVLSSVLPYSVIVGAASFAMIPEALRHTISFQIGPASSSLSYVTSLPEVAGKRITLGYTSATAADEAVLASFLPPAARGPIVVGDIPSSIPAYLVQVRPELRIQGQVAMTGAAVGLGATEQFRMVVNRPQLGPDAVDNSIVAGSYRAIVLSLDGLPDVATSLAQAEAALAAVRGGNLTGLTKDDILGQFLHGVGLHYWSQLALANKIATKVHGVATSRVPSLGAFAYDLTATEIFDVPVRVRSGLLTTDIDLDVQVVVARNGDPVAARTYLGVTGLVASRLEASIYDQTINPVPSGAGVSAAHFLEFANEQGIPTYTVSQDNLQTVLPRLQIADPVKVDILTAIAAGKIVTVPEREMVKDEFRGIGYVILDPATGAGAYLISGGLAGGGFTLPTVHPLVALLIASLLGVLAIWAAATASAGIAALGLALALIVIAYDFVSQMLSIVNNNPDLTDDQIDGIAGTLGVVAAIGAVLAVVGVFATAPVAVGLLILVTLYYLIYSTVASFIVAQYARIQNRRNTDPEPIHGA